MSDVKPRVTPEAEQREAEQQKYYDDKAAMERAVTDSICNFVFMYGGRLQIEVNAVAEDIKTENGQMINRRVWTDRVKVVVSKD